MNLGKFIDIEHLTTTSFNSIPKPILNIHFKILCNCIIHNSCIISKRKMNSYIVALKILMPCHTIGIDEFADFTPGSMKTSFRLVNMLFYMQGDAR